jgi:hypothetical protein
MAQTQKTVSRYTQIAIIANIALFGIFGFIYLIKSSNLIGTMLLLAGFTNIIFLLFNFNKKNTFFMVLNFVYAAISFIVFYDFKNPKIVGYIWLAITLYYLISGLYLMYRLNQQKKKATAAP